MRLNYLVIFSLTPPSCPSDVPPIKLKPSDNANFVCRCEDSCEFVGTTTGRVCDPSCADGDPYGTLGCAAGADYGDLGYFSTEDFGPYCRVCFVDTDAALTADTPDNRAIM